jgi:hypothetical protein
MSGIGIDISKHESKGVKPFLGKHLPYVITVCDRASERCPIFPGAVKRLEWNFPDPAAMTAPEAIEELDVPGILAFAERVLPRAGRTAATRPADPLRTRRRRPRWRHLRSLTTSSDRIRTAFRCHSRARDGRRVSAFQRVNLWSGPCATMACPTTPLTSAYPGRRSGSSALCGGLLSHKRGFRKPATRG